MNCAVDWDDTGAEGKAPNVIPAVMFRSADPTHAWVRFPRDKGWKRLWYQ